MALVEIQKVQIVAFAGMKMDVISSLQEQGLIQIENTNREELGLSTTTPDVSHIDQTLHRLAHALDYLSGWEEEGFGKRLLGQKPPLSLRERTKILNSGYLSILERAEKLEREKNNLLSQIRFLEKETEFLVLLKDLDIPIKAVKDTEKTKIQIGFIPASRSEELQSLTDDGNMWWTEIDGDKRFLYILIIYFHRDETLVDETLQKLSYNPLYFTDHVLERTENDDRVTDVVSKIAQEIGEKEERIKALERESQKLAGSRQKLMCVYDVLQNEKERLLSVRLLGETERAFFLEGWIRADDIKRLQSELGPYSDYIEYYFRSPTKNEEPPVALENPKVWRPFEIVTKLYGLPQRGSMDPTIALAPFFFLFVGLTVSEAGYGLLVSLLSFLFIKLAKPKGGLRQFLTLLTILGVATVILGTLVGGWFGFPIRQLLVIDPLEDPVSFLMLSLALGFVQVWFGTLLRMISEIKRKNFLEGLFVQGGWLVLLPFLVLYGLTKTPLWGIFALAGASGIVFFGSPSRNPIVRFFGGLYKLYDISRYLADVLSYSRLLALGLATSVIAMVVNTLCQTVLGIPWVGWLLAALIFLGGHLFNLGISFLGGFVHSMRLQFVEFFSKFFRSGGRPFKPFELEAKYVEFTE